MYLTDKRVKEVLLACYTLLESPNISEEGKNKVAKKIDELVALTNRVGVEVKFIEKEKESGKRGTS